MQASQIKRMVAAFGVVAALAMGTGLGSAATGTTPTAQASELAQPVGDYIFHGPGSFHGQRFWSRHGFSHRYWGFGFHRYYPASYVVYNVEPVNMCSAYYFADGAWYCFVGE